MDKPLKIKKYKLEGIEVQNLINKGVLRMSSKFIPDSQLAKHTNKIMKLANSSFKVDGQSIKLIHRGEASCLAFSQLCKSEKNLIVIDERTTRMLAEAPEKLKNLMERKLHVKIKIEKQKIEKFKNFRFIRSTELVYIAYKKNLFDLKKDKNLLDALLYSLKFKGTAISSREISEIKNLV